MFYCTDCAKTKGWPVTGFRSVGACEVCGTEAACCDMPTSMLPPAGELTAMEIDPALIQLPAISANEAIERMRESFKTLDAAGRPMPLPTGGLVRRGRLTPLFGRQTRLPRRDAPVPELSDLGSLDDSRAPETPPTAPSVPAVFRRLSAESLSRWVKRVTSIDQGLRLHCQKVRRGFAAESATLRATMEETRWPFPSFVPRARPFDWSVDVEPRPR